MQRQWLTCGHRHGQHRGERDRGELAYPRPAVQCTVSLPLSVPPGWVIEQRLGRRLGWRLAPCSCPVWSAWPPGWWLLDGSRSEGKTEKAGSRCQVRR